MEIFVISFLAVGFLTLSFYLITAGISFLTRKDKTKSELETKRELYLK